MNVSFFSYGCAVPLPWEFALSYIDPGTTQSVFSALAPMIAALLAFIMALLWPARWLWRRTLGRPFRRRDEDAAPSLDVQPGISRRTWLKWCVVATGVAVVAGVLAKEFFSGWGKGKRMSTDEDGTDTGEGRGQRFDRVIVIGMDGLDPHIAGDLMDRGELPSFARLRADGTFARLQSSNPSQSPVAWSSAATGSGPGRHSLFDFIRRDPSTYTPELALLHTGSALKRSAMYEPVRSGTAFWSVTSQYGVPTSVTRWPVTFPPESVSGQLLSGLGVPDITGGLGRYSFYTTRPVAQDDPAPECVTHIDLRNGQAETSLAGPMVASLTGHRQLQLPLAIEKAGASVKVRIDHGAPVSLSMGEWSDWLSVRFGGRLSRIPGMVRLYLVSAEPDLALYVSPIHVDPRDPAVPISHPEGFAPELASAIGPYHTLGIPEDTKAVTEGRFGDKPFLEQCGTIMDEREAMLGRELAAFRTRKRGLLAFVFDTSDRIQHIYWRTRDPRQPAYDPEHARRYGRVIADHYKRLDAALGRVLDAAGDDTLVLVMSDHGFTTFRRAVHLNRWFIDSGYMKLKGGKAEGAGLLRDVDWSATKAYAVGFSSIYLNVKGREGKGIVPPGESQRALAREIAAKLKTLRDPKTGEDVVRDVHLSSEIYSGPKVSDAPDLVVGYAESYRASWQTALGAAPAPLIEDNTKAWSGTHLCDPTIVPGVLFCSAKLRARHAHITDIAPTIIEALGLRVPGGMDGRSLLR